MASKLTEVAYHARKTIKYGGFVLAGITILTVIIFPIIRNIYRVLNPPQPLALSSNRSLLPLVNFPDIKDYNYQFNFQLANNKLPDFPDRAFVFYISPGKKLGFATKTDAEAIASEYGFTSNVQSLGDYKYRWVRNAPAPLTIDINANNNFAVSISYEWQNDNALKSAQLNVNKDVLINQVTRLIDQASVTTTDLNLDNPQYIYFSDVGNKLEETKSLSEADFVRLDFYKYDISYFYNDLYFYSEPDYSSKFKDIEYSYKVVGDQAMQANIYAVISGDTSRAQRGIIEAKISQSDVSYLNPIPYYLKPVKTAKIELENGNAYIANEPEDDSDPITIRRVYLAYYDSSQYQQYLQPVYIFAENELFDTNNPTLEPGFVAYVPAIRVDQLEQ